MLTHNATLKKIPELGLHRVLVGGKGGVGGGAWEKKKKGYRRAVSTMQE